MVTDLRFHSMCPHHLLPYEGRAHVAYVPGKQVVGFGRLRRWWTASPTGSSSRRISRGTWPARSRACWTAPPPPASSKRSRRACASGRDKQRDAVTHAEAYEGRLRKDGALRRELWTRLGMQR